MTLVWRVYNKTKKGNKIKEEKIVEKKKIIFNFFLANGNVCVCVYFEHFIWTNDKNGPNANATTKKQKSGISVIFITS